MTWRKRLTPEEVIYIRSYLAAHTYFGAQTVMAKKFDVPPNTISRIATNKMYLPKVSRKSPARLLMDAAPQLLAALKAVEWRGAHADPRCPKCRNLKDEGHTTDCQLAAAIAAAEGKP